jgi:ubiquinone/menaquinone biosynthesis C-methylase UbiE
MTSLNNEIADFFRVDEAKRKRRELLGENFLTRRIHKYEKCGEETIDFINNLNPSLVLDLGCGDNQYKTFIKNLIGIDIVNDAADIKADIITIPFDDSSADAVLCFGSINFGEKDLIRKQLLEVKRVLKNDGYAIFRGNMKDHNDTKNMYYGWDTEKVTRWTQELNMKLYEEPVQITRTTPTGKKNLEWNDRMARRSNTEKRTPYRLFWIWKK